MRKLCIACCCFLGCTSVDPPDIDGGIERDDDGGGGADVGTEDGGGECIPTYMDPPGRLELVPDRDTYALSWTGREILLGAERTITSYQLIRIRSDGVFTSSIAFPELTAGDGTIITTAIGACGNAAIAGFRGSRTSTPARAFAALLDANDDPSWSVELAPVAPGSTIPLRMVGLSNGFIVVQDGVARRLSCTGQLGPSVDLVHPTAIECPDPCRVAELQHDGDRRIAVVIGRYASGGLYTNLSFKVLDTATPSLVSEGTALDVMLPDERLRDLTSCGAGCFALLSATDADAFLVRFDGDGTPLGSKMRLAASGHFFLTSSLVGTRRFFYVLGGYETIGGPAPHQLFVLDEYGAPADGSATARALELPRMGRECQHLLVTGAAISETGAAFVRRNPQPPGFVCGESPAHLITVGCP